MKYYLGNDTIHIFPKLLKYIGSGREGKVYLYKGNALKIFHEGMYAGSMNSTTCVGLQRMETKRILMPKNILLDANGDFKGYDTRYIDSEQCVYDVTKEKFIHEINELAKELDMLSKKRITIDDWHYDNFKYDGKFRMIDPGLYRYNKDIDINEIKERNYYVLRDFIFFELLKQRLMTEMDEYMKILNKLFDETENNIIDFFESEMNEDETLNQYVKRIAKTNHFMI